MKSRTLISYIPWYFHPILNQLPARSKFPGAFWRNVLPRADEKLWSFGIYNSHLECYNHPAFNFLSVFQFYAPAVTQENQIMQLLSARARITGQDSMSDTSVIRVMPWLVLLSEDAWSAANGVEMYQHVRVRPLRKCGGVCYLKVLIGNFRDPETLTFKTRLKAKRFI